MKMFASQLLELTKLVVMHNEAIFSRMKRQSTSICLVRSWKTGLETM